MAYCVAVKCLLTLTLCALLVSHTSAKPLNENLSFKRINFASISEDQNSIGNIEEIVQDRHGFIWVGGLNGLARFDGYDVKFYKHSSSDPRSISSDNVRDVLIDKNNIMWLATSAGLSRYDEELDSFTNGFNLKNAGLNIAISELTSLAIANDNSLIIGTDKGLVILGPDREKTTLFFHQENNANSISSNQITDVLSDSQGVIWITTMNGVNSIDLSTGKINRFYASPKDPNGLSMNHATRIFEDSQNQIWIGFYNGDINRLDRKRKIFHHFQSRYLTKNNSLILDIKETSDGKILFAADHVGLLVYTPDTNHHKLYKHDQKNDNSIDSNQVRTMFEDREGDIWVGTFTGHLNHHSQRRAVFRNYSQANLDGAGLDNRSVLTVRESKDGKIWIGTEGGFNKFDPKSQVFKQYSKVDAKSNELTKGPVISIVEDSADHLWLGTWANGLYKFDRATQNFTRFFPSEDNPYGIVERSIWSLIFSTDGKLWMGGDSSGLSIMDPQTNHFKNYKHKHGDKNSIPWRIVRKVIESQDGNYWIATFKGLCKFSPVTETCKQYDNLIDPERFLNRVLNTIIERKNGDLWMGTEGGGINILGAGQSEYTILGMKEGLPNLNVSSLVEDDNGYIWAGTLNGLARINANPPYTVKTYKQHHGLIGHSINRDSLFYSSDGLLYAGTTNGLSIFDPKKLNDNNSANQVFITDLQVLDSDSKGNTNLKGAAHLNETLNLKHHQNAFTFKFSSLQYQSPRLSNYQYRLRGFEEEWRTANRSRTAAYTNIDSGNYVFEVKRGDSSDAPITRITINIEPPYWNTWWAYCLYLIALCYAGYSLIQQKTRQLKYEKELQEKLNLKLIKLDRLKGDFLANTSHELRTPLNGIIGMAEALEYSLKGSDAHLQEQAAMIIASGKRLSSMINSVLDFSSASDDTLKLSLRPENIFLAAESALEIVRAQAQAKGIRLENQIENTGTMVLGDRERLQQIFLNLLSNAIKYTATGTVKITSQKNSKDVSIRIIDTGMGIREEAKATIFNAFSLLEDTETRSHQGAGLGLALTKRLVELHGGSIEIESSDDHGTVVKFTLQLATREAIKANLNRRDKAIEADDTTAPSPKNESEQATEEIKETSPSQPIVKSTPSTKQTSKTILVVDDDTINRMVLRGLLKFCQCHIVEASNGYEALNKVEATKDIDLIILDIMMPEISGFEVCERIREKFGKDELPIVFLSAKSTEGTEERCMEVGGNTYLTKPISKAKLIPVVEEFLTSK